MPLILILIGKMMTIEKYSCIFYRKDPVPGLIKTFFIFVLKSFWAYPSTPSKNMTNTGLLPSMHLFSSRYTLFSLVNIWDLICFFIFITCSSTGLITTYSYYAIELRKLELPYPLLLALVSIVLFSLFSYSLLFMREELAVAFSWMLMA